ncbi:hypothetical protein OTERR_04680 [Oryzomicrobium terrae]|uniref:DNA gyrase inhibitor YacG n=1 Tax=Oryzomicrobium terrae TaxID=1735038 RepID=A0A5C1E5G0_9RHOO|nr:DNA gyrase inhibitor YacG [Oryzomicrobium terrae]QEL63944.1 hypothetical protein OTERR_04680 [Oryzomicrobium terrae]
MSTPAPAPSTAPKVPCPTCGKEQPWSPENPWRPFCSERCKLIDLGAWATESYRVPLAENDGGLDEPSA